MGGFWRSTSGCTAACRKQLTELRREVLELRRQARYYRRMHVPRPHFPSVWSSQRSRTQFDSKAERSVRLPGEPSRGRGWSSFLPALIAVIGLAAGCAQSRVPTVEAVSFTSSPVRGDTYELGEKIEVTVRFDRSVDWSEGRTELALTIGDHIRYAQAHSISFGDQELRFFYTVRAEDRDGDGISIPANALSLVGSSITLAGDAETDAVLTHDAFGTNHFGRVDGTASSAHDLRTAAVRLRNRAVEFAADILSNFVSSVRYRMYPVDADPCPPVN